MIKLSMTATAALLLAASQTLAQSPPAPQQPPKDPTEAALDRVEQLAVSNAQMTQTLTFLQKNLACPQPEKVCDVTVHVDNGSVSFPAAKAAPAPPPVAPPAAPLPMTPRPPAPHKNQR